MNSRGDFPTNSKLFLRRTLLSTVFARRSKNFESTLSSIELWTGASHKLNTLNVFLKYMGLLGAPAQEKGPTNSPPRPHLSPCSNRQMPVVKTVHNRHGSTGGRRVYVLAETNGVTMKIVEIDKIVKNHASLSSPRLRPGVIIINYTYIDRSSPSCCCCCCCCHSWLFIWRFELRACAKVHLYRIITCVQYRSLPV